MLRIPRTWGSGLCYLPEFVDHVISPLALPMSRDRNMLLELEIKTEKMTSGYFMESGQKAVCLLKLVTNCCRSPSADLGGWLHKAHLLCGAILAKLG